MNIKIEILSIGLAFMLVHVFQISFYIKKLIWGKKKTFRRMKPFDCYPCLTLWICSIAHIYNGFTFDSLINIMATYVVASLINKIIEQ